MRLGRKNLTETADDIVFALNKPDCPDPPVCEPPYKLGGEKNCECVCIEQCAEPKLKQNPDCSCSCPEECVAPKSKQNPDCSCVCPDPDPNAPLGLSKNEQCIRLNGPDHVFYEEKCSCGCVENKSCPDLNGSKQVWDSGLCTCVPAPPPPGEDGPIYAVAPKATNFLAPMVATPQCINEAEYNNNLGAYEKLEGPFNNMQNCEFWSVDFCGYWKQTEACWLTTFEGAGELAGAQIYTQIYRNGFVTFGESAWQCAFYGYVKQTCDPTTYTFNYEAGGIDCANANSISVHSPTRYPLFYEQPISPSDPIKTGSEPFVWYNDLGSCPRSPLDSSCPGGFLPFREQFPCTPIQNPSSSTTQGSSGSSDGSSSTSQSSSSTSQSSSSTSQSSSSTSQSSSSTTQSSSSTTQSSSSTTQSSSSTAQSSSSTTQSSSSTTQSSSSTTQSSSSSNGSGDGGQPSSSTAQSSSSTAQSSSSSSQSSSSSEGDSSSSSSGTKYFCVVEKYFTESSSSSSSNGLVVSSSSSQAQQNLFDKDSWANSVAEPYKTYLDQAAERWQQFVKFNPEVFQAIKLLEPTWNGIALDSFSQFNDSNSGIIASCGPTQGVDLIGDPVMFNSTNFGVSVNSYYQSTFSANDWVNIMTHELGHALGIGVFWDPSVTGTTGGVAPSYNFLDGTAYDAAQQAYNSITSSVRQKVPLEDQGGDGTASSHWEDDYRPSVSSGSMGVGYAGLSNELMVGYYSQGMNSVISDLSIKILVDFGYEAVAEGLNEGIPSLSTGVGLIEHVGTKLNCKVPDKVKMIPLNLPSLSARRIKNLSFSGGNCFCVAENEFNPELHEIIAMHDSLESCQTNCTCGSSSSSGEVLGSSSSSPTALTTSSSSSSSSFFQYDPNKLVLVYDTSKEPENNTVSLPLAGTVDAIVDWGDGSTENFNTTGFKTHTYANPGVYVVQVSGSMTSLDHGIGNVTTSNKPKLVRCLSFGNIGLTSLQRGFRSCANLAECPAFLPTTVTNCNETFRNCTSFVGAELEHWNTSFVVNMSGMFVNCSSLNADLSGWSVALVTNMSNMFYNCSTFNSNLAFWSVASATTISNMFYNADSYTSDMEGWDLSGLDANNRLDNFMTSATGLTTLDYDSTLVGWNNNKSFFRNDLRPNFGGSKYTSGSLAAAARASLVAYGWTITDGGAA